MNKPLISVIIPIYNVEKYLHKCVESVLSQTYANLEIILVDDGSPDNCPNICDNFATRDHRVKVLHKTNGGLSDARNSGLDAASGEFIMFVDSDDYISCSMVSELYEAVLSSNADLSICSFQYVYESDSFQNEAFEPPIKDEIVNVVDIFNDKLSKEYSWAWVVSVCKLYKRKLFDNVRFKKGKLHEDEFILHEILLQCDQVACVSAPLYYYYKRSGSITTVKKSDVRRLDKVEAMIHRAEAFIELEGYDKAIVCAIDGAISNFLSYYSTTEYYCDREHIARNAVLQKRFRSLLKMFKRRNFAISCPKKAKYFLAYVNLYLFGKTLWSGKKFWKAKR